MHGFGCHNDVHGFETLDEGEILALETKVCLWNPSNLCSVHFRKIGNNANPLLAAAFACLRGVVTSCHEERDKYTAKIKAVHAASP